jgi:hypothetical protein
LPEIEDELLEYRTVETVLVPDIFDLLCRGVVAGECGRRVCRHNADQKKVTIRSPNRVGTAWSARRRRKGSNYLFLCR